VSRRRGKRHVAGHRRRRIAVVGTLCLVLTGSLAGHPGDEEGVWVNVDKLQRVKAAFVYNFLKYVQWPEQVFAHPGQPFEVCVVDAAEFAHTLLHTVGERTAAGRAVVVRGIRSVDSLPPHELCRCHMIYADVADAGEWRRLIDQLGPAPVLTVGEGRGFAEDGGIIGFGIVEAKVAVFINRQAARRASLEISAKLLKRAEIVTDKRRHDR